MHYPLVFTIQKEYKDIHNRNIYYIYLHSINMSDANSVISGLSDDEEQIAEMLSNERMYYVLSQFFETDDHKNVTTVLADIASELKALRKAVEAIATKASSSK